MTDLFRSDGFSPREVFSVSQIEKAFGAGYETLTLNPDGTVTDNDYPGAPVVSGTGCLRSWAYRYLSGLKQPEYTWEQACALPEDTEPLRRLKGGAKAKTWGKVAEREIERYLRGDPSLQTTPIDPHVLVGLGLLPHPSEMAGYALQEGIRITTEVEGFEPISWQGFKDFVPTLIGGKSGIGAQNTHWHQRYLIDFKTTKPIVNKKDNIAAGRALDAWAYMKDPGKLTLDWQFNLYQWGEYVTHGALVPARWVYFASPGTERYPNKPEARASDVPSPALETVRGVVEALDTRARLLRDLIRSFRNQGLTVEAVQGNTLACSAFGGCPYRSTVGGPCTVEENTIVPIGRLTSRVPTYKPPAHPGTDFTFTPKPLEIHKGVPQPMTIMSDIAARLAQQNAPTQALPAAGFGAPVHPPHAPGYPHSASAHIGAPVPTAGMPAVFPASIPFAFGAPAPQATAPVQLPPPPIQAVAPITSSHPRGTPGANPDYVCDGHGGWMPTRDWLTEPPTPAAVLPSPTPGLPPEAFMPGGAFGPAVPTSAPVGAPAPPPIAEKPRRGRRTNAQIAADSAAPGRETEAVVRDTTPAPAGDDTVSIRVETPTGYYQVSAPGDLALALKAYAQEQLGIKG